MVSAAKLRKAQMAIMAQRPYAKKIGRLIRTIVSMSETPISTPLITPEKPVDRPRILVIAVTSDRGLCGGFNGNIVKRTQKWMQENESRCQEIKVGFLGKKAKEFFRNRGMEPHYFEEFGRKATFAKARELTDFVTKEYLDGKFDEVKFIYNEFKNAISQRIVTEHFVPLLGNSVEEALKRSEDVAGWDFSDKETAAKVNPDLYLVKPSPQEVADRLIQKHFAIQIYRIMLESQASEHGARMSAMENSTKNAGEMLQKLTLEYNKSRQAAITAELLDIIGGAESQNA